MEVLYRSCCGIDVHKQFLVACLLIVDEAGCQHKELRRFSTMTGDLLTCVDWLKAAQCWAVAMERARGLLEVTLEHYGRAL